MPKYVCKVCKNEDGAVRPCQVISAGEGMEHKDLCVVTGEFGVAEFEKESMR